VLDLGRTFLQSVDRAGGNTALVDGALRLTWSEWARVVGGVQRGLAALGLRPGDHVLAVLQNRHEAATLHWACQFAGLVMTPLNWRAKPEELDYALLDSGARLLVYEAVSQEPVAQSVLARTVMRVVVGDVGSDDPRFGQVFAEPADPTPLARADDLSLMLYTSGTTGAPKGVPRRQHAERVAALAHVAQNRYGYGERTLGVMPLYHTMGVRSLLTMALVDGRFVCMPRFDAAAALRAIEAERVSHLYLVPTLYHDLLSHPEFKRTDTQSVRLNSG
jgi:2-furoate---CoA ligase